MKPLQLLLILTIFFGFTLSPAYGQKTKSYRAWVTLMDKTKVNGVLYAANEDALTILDQNRSLIKYDPELIERIKVRRQGSIGKGAWIGAAGGLFLGAVAGYAFEGEDSFEGTGAASGGVIGIPIGALIGVGIGSGKEKFTVEGDRDTYLSLLPWLQKHTSRGSR